MVREDISCSTAIRSVEVVGFTYQFVCDLGDVPWLVANADFDIQDILPSIDSTCQQWLIDGDFAVFETTCMDIKL